MKLVRKEEAARHPEMYFEGYPDMRYDDQTAYVHSADLERMPEYSSTVPTGVCDGKLWKRKTEIGWLLGSYEWDEPEAEDPGIFTKFRHLIVLDSMDLFAVTDEERARCEKLRVLGCRFATQKDGREIEITLRPLLFGNYQLCLGPRDDDFGFDESFMYDELDEALKGFNSWAPDYDDYPPGNWTRDDNAHHGLKEG